MEGESHQRTTHLALRMGRPEEMMLGVREGRAGSQVLLTPEPIPADVQYLTPQGALSALQPKMP